MPRKKGRGRAILGAGARTLGRGLLRVVTRSDAGKHWAKVGEDWFATLGELKGAAMKLGQLVSQYQDLLPPQLAEQLVKLQATAEPLPWAEIEPLLDQYWQPEQRAQVVRIEPQALASASIGQVHRATLADGSEVVIKLQYPGVAEAVDADVSNLGRILRLAGVLPLDKAALDGVLGEVRSRLREEVNYSLERERLKQFRPLAQPHGILVPETVPELCGRRLLALAHEAGSSATEARAWTQAIRNQIGAQLVDWLIAQVFEHGLLHADPHPGNFAFRESGEILLYDFGCVKQIRPREQQLMADVVAHALNQDWAGIYACLGEIGSLSQPQRPMSTAIQRVIESQAESFFEALLTEPHFDFRDRSVIPRARLAVKQALPHWRAFKPVPELAFVARTLSGSYWLLRSLGAEVDLKSRFERIARDYASVKR